MFIIEGPKLLSEILNSSYKIQKIFALSSWFDENQIKITSDTDIYIVSQKELERISGLKTPNQVLAVAQIPEKNLPSNQIDDLVLVLDNISDPGNMGTIIRTADWFGIRHIICSENCVAIYNPKVVQATMGSIFRLEFHYMDLEKYLSTIPETIPVYGTLLKGSNVFTSKLTTQGIIIIGNESQGISTDIHPFISNKISIPSFAPSESASAESLNAAIATGIILAEFKKRSTDS